MPSVCIKPDNKISSEVENSSKQCIIIVEKKVRNLEKRKGKLDGYRAKQNEGEELSRDQLDAVSRYDSVVQSLELARELQKMFQQVSVDVDKMLKKKAKREKLENQSHETQRMHELLKLQSMLEEMGSDTAQEDFKAGTNGALALSENNVSQLDELYKLINPTREDGKVFDDQLVAAADHVSCLLDAKDKEVAGTTYKDLYKLVNSIHECGYFDKEHQAAAPDEPSEAPEEVEEEDRRSPAEFSMPAETDSQKDDIQDLATVKSEPVSLAAISLQTDEPEQIVSVPESAPAAVPRVSQMTDMSQDIIDDAYYTSVQQAQQQQQQQAFQRTRPFKEIVSSVQGNFNFLQDSEIDLDSPHQVDPAVVAMATSSTAYAAPIDCTLSGSAYQASGLLGQEDAPVSQYSSHSSQVPATDPLSSQATDSGLEAAMAAAAAVGVTPEPVSTQASHPGSQYGAASATSQFTDAQPSTPTATYAEQTYTGKYHSDQSYSQSLDPSSAPHTPHPTTYGVEQLPSIESAVSSDVPQPIPLPSQTLPGQSLYDPDTATSSQQQNKKEFTMNPNADPFQSMYGSQEAGSMSMAQTLSHTQSAAPHDAPTTSQQSSLSSSQRENTPTLQPTQDYQGSGYNSGFSSRGNGVSRSGRGSSGSSGGRGGRGMSNGYQRGGSSRGGGAYSNSSGRGGAGAGHQNGSRGSNRGAGSSGYGSYQSRGDYRQEGTYQGYATGGGGGYGGAVTGAQGSYKGGSGSRGGSRAGMRGGGGGGPTRGGSLRGAGSGPNNQRGGGFGRPTNTSQPQTA